MKYHRCGNLPVPYYREIEIFIVITSTIIKYQVDIRTVSNTLEMNQIDKYHQSLFNASKPREQTGIPNQRLKLSKP